MDPLVPGGQLVLLLAGPGSGRGGQVVDGAHAVDGGVELLQLLADAAELHGVRRQVAGVRLTGFAPPFFAWVNKTFIYCKHEFMVSVSSRVQHSVMFC